MTNSTFPQMPGIPGIPNVPPMINNSIPAPGGGGIATEPETYNWGEMLAESNIQEQPMPIGDYDAQVVAAEDGQASNGKLMFKMVWQIVSGPYAGRRLTRNMVISKDSKKAMQVFFRQMRALGLDDQFWMSNPPPYAVAERMINRMARVQITQREWPKNTGIIDNEVGFIREPINTGSAQMPQMLGPGGFPQAPQMPQQLGQPMPQQPPQQYAQPQQMPPAGQQFMTSSPEQPQPYAAPVAQPMTQAPPFAPPQQQQFPGIQQAPPLAPAQNIPVGPEYAQAPQQSAPVQFEQMLTAPPQQPAAPPAAPQQLPQPQAPEALQQPPAAPQQPQLPQQPAADPQQPTAQQIADFQAFMAAQQQGAQQPPQPPQMPPPPLPAQF